ncbi:hypothetical protein BH11ARM2_BH11ARM2_24750 [soil metagenome]
MAVPTTLVGTWEEIKAHDAELSGRRVTARIHPDEESLPLSQKERIARSLAIIEELGKGLPPYPDRVFTSDDYYPDEY